MNGRELRDIFLQRSEESSEKKKISPVIIWLIIGAVIFLAISSFTDRTDKSNKTETLESSSQQYTEDTEEYVRHLEARLTETLKKINGAGEVSVFISVDSSGEKVLATDQKESTNLVNSAEDESESQREIEKNVVLSGQGSGQTPYVVKENKPIPVGILVVAEGAGDEKVKYEIYEAVKALFGLSPHRIKITY